MVTKEGLFYSVKKQLRRWIHSVGKGGHCEGERREGGKVGWKRQLFNRVVGRKEGSLMPTFNSLYNILLLRRRPLRLSSDSHFRTYTVLERITPYSACSIALRRSIIRLPLLFSYIDRKIIHLMLSCFRDVFFPSQLQLFAFFLRLAFLCTFGSSALLLDFE